MLNAVKHLWTQANAIYADVFFALLNNSSDFSSYRPQNDRDSMNLKPWTWNLEQWLLAKTSLSPYYPAIFLIYIYECIYVTAQTNYCIFIACFFIFNIEILVLYIIVCIFVANKEKANPTNVKRKWNALKRYSRFC